MINIAKFCDFVGNEYKRESIAEYKECAKRCENTPDCTHFTWNGGLCYLKSGSVNQSNAVSREDFICGLYAPLIPGIRLDIYFYIAIQTSNKISVTSFMF